MTKASTVGPKEQQLRDMRERQLGASEKAAAPKVDRKALEQAMAAAAQKKAAPETGKRPQKRKAKGRAKKKRAAPATA